MRVGKPSYLVQLSGVFGIKPVYIKYLCITHEYSLSHPRNREEFEYDPLPLPLCISHPQPLCHPRSLAPCSSPPALWTARSSSSPEVARAVGAVRVGVPLLHRRIVAGVLRLLLEVGGACIVAGRRPWQTCRGGEPNPACIHEYTVFSRVFSHGSNTRIIRVNTYSEYVFTT